MGKQVTLFKGELMEELLRAYFLSLGYYVARSVKYKYETFDITDVDVYLYGRSSSLTRERINVDLKNKKSPQTFERILWVNGLKALLGFDACIVATTDQRPVIHKYGHMHSTKILDGTFLAKLRTDKVIERLTEEDLLEELSKYKNYKIYGNKDWKFLYEQSKSKLLSEQDFSGFNSTLTNLHYFIEKSLINDQQRILALRMVYITFSHLLIIMDFILKDIVYLQPVDKEHKLSDGLKFGNLGKDGVDKIINMAVQISGATSANTIMKSLENIPTDILKEYFSKNEVAKNVFNWAREFESLGYKKDFVLPNNIDSSLKGVMSVLLDYYGIDRRSFFDLKL